MKAYTKQIITELIWLIISGLISVLICRFVFLYDFSSKTIDLHLHDTYIVLSASLLLILLFLIVAFVLYLFKESRQHFARTLPNSILLIVGFLLIVSIAYFSKEMTRLNISFGWTAYPPLSSLQYKNLSEATLDPYIVVITNVLLVLQLLVTTVLLYVAFCWGTKRNIAK